MMQRLTVRCFDALGVMLGAVMTVCIVWPFAAGRRMRGANRWKI